MDFSDLDYDLTDPLGPMADLFDLAHQDMVEALAEIWSLGARASVEEIAHLLAGLAERGLALSEGAKLLGEAELRADELRADMERRRARVAEA